MAYVVLAVLPLFLVSSQSVELQRDLGFDRVDLGLGVSACYGIAAVTASPFGRLIERHGPELGLRLAAFLSLASLLVLAAAASWWHVAVAMVICGGANASAQIASNVAVADGVATGRAELAFGAKQAAVPLSALVAGAFVATLGVMAGGRGNALMSPGSSPRC